MPLEIIEHAPASPRPGAPTLVFVHGAYCGAWVWDVHFLPFFAARGYRALALSLRGHGRSAPGPRPAQTHLRDYVADLRQVAAGLGRTVVIGHSMGGMVVQHWIGRRPAGCAGAVLMASVPPHGLFDSALAMGLGSPRLAHELARVHRLGPHAADHRRIWQSLVSEATPVDVLEPFLAAFRPEPPGVIADLMGADRPPPPPRGLPVLVLGSTADRFVPTAAVEATAAAFRTRPMLIPTVGHAMMLDHHWADVARPLASWLDALQDPRAAGDPPASGRPASAHAG